MATFVGSSQAGFIGGLIATLGVVLPSFVIIFIIASIMKDLLKYSGVKAMLSGIRPCVVAMILATGITMALSIVSIVAFSRQSAKFISSGRLSSSPLFLRAPVHANSVATEFVEVSSPLRCL